MNKDTAWRIAMKIRQAMSQYQQRELLTGIVEIDEAYIGGKPRKEFKGQQHPRGMGSPKIPVVGMVERGGKVKARVVKKEDLKCKKLSALVRSCVDIKNCTVMTDEFGGYFYLKDFVDHKIVRKTIWYVNGDIHVNNIESFWALLKRGIVGQFHKVSLKHLPKYVDEFCYRYNERKTDRQILFNTTIQKGLRLWQ